MILKAVKEEKAWQSIWKNDQSEARELNDRLMMAERAFTDRDGLLGRSWYKHLVSFYKHLVRAFHVVVRSDLE